MEGTHRQTALTGDLPPNTTNAEINNTTFSKFLKSESLLTENKSSADLAFWKPYLWSLRREGNSRCCSVILMSLKNDCCRSAVGNIKGIALLGYWKNSAMHPMARMYTCNKWVDEWVINNRVGDDRTLCLKLIGKRDIGLATLALKQQKALSYLAYIFMFGDEPTGVEKNNFERDSSNLWTVELDENQEVNVKAFSEKLRNYCSKKCHTWEIEESKILQNKRNPKKLTAV